MRTALTGPPWQQAAGSRKPWGSPRPRVDLRCSPVLVPVILSGGSGTRLWPLSRRRHPKQLQALLGARTMLQQTVARTEGLAGVTDPIVVCNASHEPLVRAQLEAIGRAEATVVLEPVGRNTAPAIALAALVAQARWPKAEPVLLVLPADHVIGDEAAFHEAVRVGLPLAAAGRLVTFGIVPEGPHTGYGYIRAAAPGEPGPVEAFVEKPDRETAEGYLRHGGYYWNSGMFLLGAKAYLDELGALRPAIRDTCERALAADPASGSVDAEVFGECPSDSIDYAVMEKTSRASVVPLSAGWSDVGSWSALHDVSPQDDDGNTTVGDVLALECTGSYLHARHRLVAAVGLHDVVVVETEDAVLVAARDRSEQVKQVVTMLQERGRPETGAYVATHGSRIPAQTLSVDGPASVQTLQLTPGLELSAVVPAGTRRRVVVLRGAGRIERGEDEPGALALGDSVWVGDDESIVAGPEGLVLMSLDFPAP